MRREVGPEEHIRHLILEGRGGRKRSAMVPLPFKGKERWWFPIDSPLWPLRYL